MKKILLFLLIAVLVSSCQPKANVAPVDTEAEKKSITEVLDKVYSGLSARDANPYLMLLTDDALVLGTDSKEFWNKSDISQMSAQMFADTTFNFDIRLDKREVRISKDGNSAIVIEQMMAGFISPEIPMRRVFHMVKNNDTWQIDFDCSAMVPDNKDLPAINNALKEVF